MEHALDFFMRWTHFIAALIWIGHNYANVVQRPTYRPLAREELVNDASTAPSAMPRLSPGLLAS